MYNSSFNVTSLSGLKKFYVVNDDLLSNTLQIFLKELSAVCAVAESCWKFVKL